MRGGYSVVAAVLNRAYDWPDERDVTRQWVENVHLRRTPNKARQLPPSSVEERPEALRTTPVHIFETDDWVEYARPGVRGERRRGWVVPVPRGTS
jgi:hypothetical protein